VNNEKNTGDISTCFNRRYDRAVTISFNNGGENWKTFFFNSTHEYHEPMEIDKFRINNISIVINSILHQKIVLLDEIRRRE
jgi:hypothetical protein